MIFHLINFIFVLIIPRVENKAGLTCDSLKHMPFHEGNMGQTGIVSWLGVIRAHLLENKAGLTCDSLKHMPFHEGNMGQTGIVSWLGVIRAHLHFGTKVKIAVTGAVLIKPKYAIANADDMAKIRKKGESKAMFISQDRGPWTCKLSEVSVHPEYEFATYNTIALVELDTESLTNNAPMLPICMPAYMYNTSNQLYAIGFTDENKLLEKVAYKVEHVEKDLCEEFYNRSGHEKGLDTPVFYECAFAINSVKNCDWENGMALVSNASGHWVLIGFGIQGPGCSAPARFIDVYPYLHWIESASNLGDFDADYPFKVKFRKSDLLPSPENFTDAISTTNYSKRDYATTNNTKFLGVDLLLDNINTDNVFQKRDEPLNTTSREFLIKKAHEKKVFGVEKEHNVTLHVTYETNFLKRNHKPLNMTFREFLKQKQNEAKSLGEEKVDTITLQ